MVPRIVTEQTEQGTYVAGYEGGSVRGPAFRSSRIALRFWCRTVEQRLVDYINGSITVEIFADKLGLTIEAAEELLKMEWCIAQPASTIRN